MTVSLRFINGFDGLEGQGNTDGGNFFAILIFAVPSEFGHVVVLNEKARYKNADECWAVGFDLFRLVVTFG